MSGNLLTDREERKRLIRADDGLICADENFWCKIILQLIWNTETLSQWISMFLLKRQILINTTKLVLIELLLMLVIKIFDSFAI